MGQKVNPLGFRLGVSQKHISHWFIENNRYSQLVVEDQLIRQFFYKKFPGIASINIKRESQRIVIEIFSANTRDLVMEAGNVAVKATFLPSQGKTRPVEGGSSSADHGSTNSGTNQINSLCKQLVSELTAYRYTLFQKKKSFASSGKSNAFSTDQKGSDTAEKAVEVELFLTKVENPNTSAACLAEFIVEQLEKRVPFRRVLKRSIQKAEEASVEGVKVQISGRLNGAEIARSERIHKGQVPLHTLRAKIEYNSRTAKTIYGLLGVKVWVFNGFADVKASRLLNKN